MDFIDLKAQYAAAQVGRSYPVSEKLAKEVICPPMRADPNEAKQQRVITAVRGFALAKQVSHE
jgi:dTDP-4-amino-4,6-dideoxygalactose transaminase